MNGSGFVLDDAEDDGSTTQMPGGKGLNASLHLQKVHINVAYFYTSFTLIFDNQMNKLIIDGSNSHVFPEHSNIK